MFQRVRRTVGGIITSVLLLAPAADASVRIYVPVPPPPPIVEVRPHHPHGYYVWHPGHHRWAGRRYVWTHGYWARAPRRHAVWRAGHWVHARRGWYWVPGRWA